MNSLRSGASFFEIPHAVVFLLMTLNIGVYALCLNQSGMAAISPEVLFRNGAMYSSAIERREYWRLVTYGFLHADLLHLATNMLCLVLWGGHLEKRIGSFYFAVVYLSALIGGGIVSDLSHSGAYLTVGASAAVSGILGALLCLWLLGRIDLAANFFVVNIGLNVALALSFSRIDWGGHLGGFAAGLISCAVLDLLEKVNAHVFRCKFPEFVKMNGLIVLGALMVYFVGSKAIPPPSGAEAWVSLAACAIACFALVKALDLLLSMKKGLVAVVIIFSAANASLVPIAISAFLPALNATCAAYRLRVPQVAGLLEVACTNMTLAAAIIAALVFAMTILAYWPALQRGINDVGFVGAGLRAERQRRQGI